MKLYPAIDLLNGRCVRLYKGNFDEVSVYGDPVATASQYEVDGAAAIHIVDLDGAREEKTAQLPLFYSISKAVSIPIQAGGGMRSAEQIGRCLDNGVSRVVVGSLAAKEPKIFRAILQEFGAEAIILAADVRWDGDVPKIATTGWKQESSLSLWEMLDFYSDTQLKHVLCTDIGRDGTLSGPNFELYASLASRYPKLQIQASGGIGTVEDLTKLRYTGVDGVVIGKALYEKKFTLPEALRC